MATNNRKLDLLLKEIEDLYVQENFYRLKLYLDRALGDGSLGGGGTPGPQGPIGPAGPVGPTPTTVPKLVVTFTTDAGTLAGHLLRVNADNTVTQITDNLSTTVPNGIFGVGLSKPSALQIDVLFTGVVGGYSGFTAGLPLFISALGVPTHTPPALEMLQQIGFAISTTELFVHLLQPMRRI